MGRFYSVHNPDMLKDESRLSEILRRYKGREDKLFADLRTKYNVKTSACDVYWRYLESTGHAPATPDQLRAFSIETATPIPWKAANDYIQSITPPPTTTPALQKRFVFYQFRDGFYSINVTHK